MPQAQPLEPGDPARLGAYEIVGRIGSGGQGVVYLGRAASGEQVAVKLFHARLDGDPAARAGFARELELAKRVARFCTAQVLDFGVVGERPYIVSEHVPGPSLHQVVSGQGPVAGGALDRLAVSTATALVALHDAGIVHRDFKPQNVLMGPDGPRVIDFGIAKALSAAETMTSGVVGTPAYMAPEQLSGGEPGLAMDVFAWASTIAYAATGRPPFGNDAIPAIINRILNGAPDLHGVQEPLRGLLAACLDKDPARRPTARQILDHLVRGQPVAPASPLVTTAPAPPPRPRGRGRTVALAAAVAAVVAAAGGAGTATLLARSGAESPIVAQGAETGRAPSTGAATTTSPGPSLTPTPSPAAEQTVAIRPSEARSEKPRTTTRPPAPQQDEEEPESSAPRSSPPSEDFPTDPAATPSPQRPKPSPTPTRLVELGAGHFSAYCVTLGWEWVEYRETPRPGAYCVKRKNDQTMYLTQAQRDDGCRWRFKVPNAFHRFKGKANYCYVYR